MAHGEAPEAAEGFRGEPRGEPRGEHGGEAEPGTQLSMDAMRRVRKFACYMWEATDGTRDQSYTQEGCAAPQVRMLYVAHGTRVRMLNVARQHNARTRI